MVPGSALARGRDDLLRGRHRLAPPSAVTPAKAKPRAGTGEPGA